MCPRFTHPAHLAAPRLGLCWETTDVRVQPYTGTSGIDVAE